MEVVGAGEGLSGLRGEEITGKSGTCGLGGTLEGLVMTSRRDSGWKEGVLTGSRGSGGSPAGGTRSGGESAESTGGAADGEAVRSDEEKEGGCARSSQKESLRGIELVGGGGTR